VVWSDANGTASLYIDGVKDATNFNYTRSGAFSLDRSALMAHVDSGPDEYVRGILDDARIYNRALSAAEATRLYQQTQSKYNSSQTDSLTHGLVGYWTFDGPDISGTRAKDRSGRDNHGTITGATKDQGKIGQALEFDGVDDMVVMTNESNFDFGRTDTFSISLWFRRRLAGSGVMELISKGQVGYEILATDAGTLAFTLMNVFDVDQVSVTIPNPADTSWHHVIFTYNGTSSCGGCGVKGYVDGTRKANSLTNDNLTGPALSNNQVTIGRRASAAQFPFYGYVDEVRIYNRVLSDAEANKLYQMGR
jgi:hypothetical protein